MHFLLIRHRFGFFLKNLFREKELKHQKQRTDQDANKLAFKTLRKHKIELSIRFDLGLLKSINTTHFRLDVVKGLFKWF